MDNFTHSSYKTLVEFSQSDPLLIDSHQNAPCLLTDIEATDGILQLRHLGNLDGFRIRPQGIHCGFGLLASD